MTATTSPQDLMAPDQPPEVLTVDSIAGLRVTGPAMEGYINLLVYGEAGVGKTRLAGSSCVVPEMAPVLLLDFEGGTLSLAGDYGAVRVVRAKSWAKVAELMDDLERKNPYKTVILDSLTEVQKFCMGEIMQEVVRKDPDRDPDIASLREWGKQGEAMRRLVRGLRDLPCNTIFTALSHEQRNENTGVSRIRPALPGQMKGEVAGYVDIVVYMYKKTFVSGTTRENKTFILTQGTESQVAKDRSGRLPLTMEEPKMQEIYDKVNGRENSETESE